MSDIRMGVVPSRVFVATEDGAAIQMAVGWTEVRRLTDPTDGAADVGGAICLGHTMGKEGIGLSPTEARALAAMLNRAADECNELIASKDVVQ